MEDGELPTAQSEQLWNSANPPVLGSRLIPMVGRYLASGSKAGEPSPRRERLLQGRLVKIQDSWFYVFYCPAVGPYPVVKSSNSDSIYIYILQVSYVENFVI